MIRAVLRLILYLFLFIFIFLYFGLQPTPGHHNFTISSTLGTICFLKGFKRKIFHSFNKILLLTRQSNVAHPNTVFIVVTELQSA